MSEVPTSHPVPVMGNNVSRYNPYDGVDRGLALLNPELGDGLTYRVKSAVWVGFGFDPAPGYIEFKLEKFDNFPNSPGVEIEGPGLGGTFNCISRTLCDNPIMIEQFALGIYQKHYKLGGPLLTPEEIENCRQMGRQMTIASGKALRIMSSESRLVFESPDGLQPIAPVSAEITYEAIFKIIAPNPGDPTEELRQYIINVDPAVYRPYQNIKDHIHSL